MEPKDEVDANDQSEQNYIYLCVQFNYNKNVREIGAAIVNLNERKLLLTEFQDNEHFSNFESLILQMNPQNSYTKFTLLINYPALSTEKAKIRDILNVSDVDAKEKTKNDFKDKGFEKDIELLLNRPLKQFLNETTMNTAMSSLACAIAHLKLSDEPSNHQQFKLNQLLQLQVTRLTPLHQILSTLQRIYVTTQIQKLLRLQRIFLLLICFKD